MAILSARDVKNVIAGLTKQGAKVSRVTGLRFKVTNEEGQMVTLSLGTTDSQQIHGGKSKLKQIGLSWPLDVVDPDPRRNHPSFGAEPSEEEVLEARRKAEAAQARIDALRPAVTAAEEIVATLPKEFVPAPIQLFPPKPNLQPVATKPDAGVGPTQVIERIDAKKAERYLAMMGPNRKLSGEIVDRLVSAMKDGHWVYDGSPIRFNVDGELVDGQHRLWAVVESDLEFDFLVVRGVARVAMATMDTGRRRSFTDVLHLEDETLTNTTSLAATVQIAYRWEKGMRGVNLSAGRGSEVVNNQLLLQFFRENRERLIDVTHQGRVISGSFRGYPASAGAIVSWVLGEYSEEDFGFFVDRLIDGVGLHATHPILALRNALIRVANGPAGRRALTTDVATALTFKAWNAFLAGNDVQVLSYRKGGANPEPYPVPSRP